MTRVAFGNSANDTNSSPFYDYQNDIIYVGDDSGNLHKFTTVFSGTPTESGSPFATTGTSNVLTSPVYDSGTSHDIFVGDSGGYVYSYNASGTHVATSSQLATGSLGILDAPVIDSSNELMYVFVGKDGNTSSTDGVGCKSGSNNCNGIFRFSIGTFNSTGIGTGTCNASTSTSWGSSGTNCGSEVAFGSAANSGSVFYDGAFDNIYYSGNGTTGNIWACSPKTGTLPRLSYAPLSLFPAAGATYGTTTAIDQLTSAATTCSPVTEVCDNGGSACDASHGTDYIFLSVTASGNVSDGGTACSGACLYGFQVGSMARSPCQPLQPTEPAESPQQAARAGPSSTTYPPPSRARHRFTTLRSRTAPARGTGPLVVAQVGAPFRHRRRRDKGRKSKR